MHISCIYLGFFASALFVLSNRNVSIAARSREVVLVAKSLIISNNLRIIYLKGWSKTTEKAGGLIKKKRILLIAISLSLRFFNSVGNTNKKSASNGQSSLRSKQKAIKKAFYLTKGVHKSNNLCQRRMNQLT